MRVIINRYWLGGRNGRIAAESGLGLEANPHRKGGPTWRAFNEAHAIAMEARQRGDAEGGSVRSTTARAIGIAQQDSAHD